MKWSLIPASVEEDSEQQTLLFHYPTVVVGPADYLNPWVKIELGARSDTESSELAAIQSYLNEALPTPLGDGFFNIRTVSARRTFWEKAMLLHEESYRPPEKRRKARMARHYYDLWCLIEKGIAEQATADAGLFERVAAHREIFFGQNWVDYATLRPGALRLLPTADQVASWGSDYEAMREHMFFGDVPTFHEILTVVSEFKAHFNQLALSRPSE